MWCLCRGIAGRGFGFGLFEGGWGGENLGGLFVVGFWVVDIGDVVLF